MRREARTIRVMIEMYCHDLHGTAEGLCDECMALSTYAMERLRRCPYQEGKTTCAKCPIHCYKPNMREQVRVVMRYAGPRMMLRHPVMAVAHLFDGRRKEPVKAVKREDVKT
jgi:predicted amidophosphoribosyltransferase